MEPIWNRINNYLPFATGRSLCNSISHLDYLENICIFFLFRFFILSFLVVVNK